METPNLRYLLDALKHLRMVSIQLTNWEKTSEPHTLSMTLEWPAFEFF